MDEIKNQFHRELGDLRSLISFYNSEIKLLGDFVNKENYSNYEILQELSSTLKGFSISKRIFNYNSIIISLYGSFERFIENILISYVDLINRLVKKYDGLPDALIKSHFNLSLALLNKLDHHRYSGILKKEDIISNLHSCVNQIEQYQLNKDAFTQHTANFRVQVIDEIFARVGIEGISTLIMKQEEFLNYVARKIEKNEGDEITLEESFYLLNDLAERRNEVAHGVPSEILQNEILIEYVNFFEIYTEALTKILNNEFWKHETLQTGKELGQITDVFQDGKIICIYTNKIPVKPGDLLIGKNDSVIVKTKVIQLQLDNKTIEFSDGKQDYELGIKIDKRFRKNFKVYLVSSN